VQDFYGKMGWFFYELWPVSGAFFRLARGVRRPEELWRGELEQILIPTLSWSRKPTVLDSYAHSDRNSDRERRAHTVPAR
jgi:hypothetical protein